MSNTVEIYGIKYKLPEMPKSSLIDNFDLEQYHQKFYKVEIPEYFEELEFDEDGNPIYSDEQRDWA